MKINRILYIFAIFLLSSCLSNLEEDYYISDYREIDKEVGALFGTKNVPSLLIYILQDKNDLSKVILRIVQKNGYSISAINIDSELLEETAIINGDGLYWGEEISQKFSVPKKEYQYQVVIPQNKILEEIDFIIKIEYWWIDRKNAPHKKFINKHDIREEVLSFKSESSLKIYEREYDVKGYLSVRENDSEQWFYRSTDRRPFDLDFELRCNSISNQNTSSDMPQKTIVNLSIIKDNVNKEQIELISTPGSPASFSYNDIIFYLAGLSYAHHFLANIENLKTNEMQKIFIDVGEKYKLGNGNDWIKINQTEPFSKTGLVTKLNLQVGDNLGNINSLDIETNRVVRVTNSNNDLNITLNQLSCAHFEVTWSIIKTIKEFFYSIKKFFVALLAISLLSKTGQS